MQANGDQARETTKEREETANSISGVRNPIPDTAESQKEEVQERMGNQMIMTTITSQEGESEAITQEAVETAITTQAAEVEAAITIQATEEETDQMMRNFSGKS